MIKIAPTIQHDDVRINMMQDRILSVLNSVAVNPILDSDILTDVVLASGDNTINHKLGRKLNGWFLTRRNAATTVYDKQATNLIPERTLVLNSSAIATVDIFVF